MIREAAEADYSAILELAGEFWKHTMFSEPFEPEHAVVMVEIAHADGLLAVLEIEGEVVGFAAGIKAPLLASTQALFGIEQAWWVSPEHRGGKNGVALLQFMERLAKEQGVKYWTMVSMQSSMPEYVNQLYEKMGYTLSETSYTKVL